MTKELYNWLELRFRQDNHPKYTRYFEEWISNITDGQILGFSKQMYNDKNKVYSTSIGH